MQPQWSHKIFNVDESNFTQLALEEFNFQYQQNALYRQYANAMQKRPTEVQSIEEIPYFPIRFFKTHPVSSGLMEGATVFESSGTTGMEKSRHFVSDISIYESSFLKGFQHFYGNINDYCIIGLLPSYLERSNSSLVYMVNELIKQSSHLSSGFYLNEFDKLATVLQSLEAAAQKTLLIGVSFALLDFAEAHSFPLKHTIIMETGGMKGRREEMVREELHSKLKKAFAVDNIHSEYGMTELLSQAYSKGEGLFHTPPWMKILIRDEDDPQEVDASPKGKALRGAINIIDLANIHSCSFIATDDVGRLYPNLSFEVLGRMDNSDIRGCSLMMVEE